MCLDKLKMNQRSYYNLLNSAFWGWLSMESQPQNPEFRINPENLHPCFSDVNNKDLHMHIVSSAHLLFTFLWTLILHPSMSICDFSETFLVPNSNDCFLSYVVQWFVAYTDGSSPSPPTTPWRKCVVMTGLVRLRVEDQVFHKIVN